MSRNLRETELSLQPYLPRVLRAVHLDTLSIQVEKGALRVLGSKKSRRYSFLLEGAELDLPACRLTGAILQRFLREEGVL